MNELEMENEAMLEQAKIQAEKALFELRVLARFAANSESLEDIRLTAENAAKEMQEFINA